MNHFVTVLFFAALLSLPASAQERELKSGLNYTTLNSAKAKATKPVNAPDAKKITEEPEITDPATLVWKKYKELATGQTEEQKKSESAGKPAKPNKPVKPKTAAANEKTQPTPQNSFGEILNKWQNNKDTQREMRSKTFKAPAPATPTTTSAKDAS